MSGKRKILVVRIGALGDVCMLAPIVRSLARMHEVHWLIRNTHQPAVGIFPDMNCRFIGCAPGPDPRKPFADDLVGMLRREKYDMLVDCSHWACVGWLAEQLREVPVRATTDDPHQDKLLKVDRGPLGLRPFSHVVPVSGDQPGVHQTGKWRRLLREACGIETDNEWPLPAPLETGVGQPLRIFLHAHAGKPEKVWPARRFAAVLAAAGRRRGLRCTINGVHESTVRSLRVRLFLSKVRLSVLHREPSFVAMRDELSRSHLAIGCDSGPMHFAALLGVPTLVVYGHYPAAEFGPLWRSTPVEPPSGLGINAVTTDEVKRSLGSLIKSLDVNTAGDRSPTRCLPLRNL